MAGIPISIRLDQPTTQTLQDAARAAGSPVATYAAKLIRSGLSREHSDNPDWDESTCLKGVVVIFQEIGDDDDDALVWGLGWLEFLRTMIQPKYDRRVKELHRLGREMPTDEEC
jgi:hypothetical protein